MIWKWRVVFWLVLGIDKWLSGVWKQKSKIQIEFIRLFDSLLGIMYAPVIFHKDNHVCTYKRLMCANIIILKGAIVLEKCYLIFLLESTDEKAWQLQLHNFNAQITIS